MPTTLTSARSQTWKGHVALLGQTILISLGYIFGREAAQHFDPLALTGLRALLSGVVYAGILLIGGRSESLCEAWQSLPKSYQRRLLHLAILGIFFNQLLFNWGLRYTTAATTAIIYALTPSVVFFLGVWLFRRERLIVSKLLPLMLAYGGVILALWHNFLHSDYGWGAGLLGVAVIFWGFYLNYSPPIIEKVGAFRVTGYIMILGALLHGPTLMVGLWRQAWVEVTIQSWLSLFYLVAAMSVAAYLLLSYGLKFLTPTQAALYINLQPITTLLIAASMGREPLTWQLLLAALLTSGGMVLFRR
jgi:drug/metabolite transporter (DMT)-like permease